MTYLIPWSTFISNEQEATHGRLKCHHARNCKSSGVSLSTVFRVLNSDVPVSPTTRAKVLAVQRILQKKKPEVPLNSEEWISVGIITPSCSASDLDAHPSLFTILTSFVETLSLHGTSNTTIVFDERTMTADTLLSSPRDRLSDHRNKCESRASHRPYTYQSRNSLRIGQSECQWSKSWKY